MMQKEFKLPLEKRIYHREKTKQYRLEHPEARRRANIQQRVYVQKHREELLDLLGRVCAQCGFFDVRALQIDHKNGQAVKDRKRFNSGGGANLPFYQYYLRHPEEAKLNLQILCANCNWIKRRERGEENFGSKIYY